MYTFSGDWDRDSVGDSSGRHCSLALSKDFEITWQPSLRIIIDKPWSQFRLNRGRKVSGVSSPKCNARLNPEEGEMRIVFAEMFPPNRSSMNSNNFDFLCAPLVLCSSDCA